MRRRAFSIGCASAAVLVAPPIRLAAQSRATAVIGSLNANSPGPFEVPLTNAWLNGLGETGFVQGQNLRVEDRWALAQYDRLPQLAADLVGRKVDVIVVGSLPGALAAKTATSTIPIVFALGADPVAAGLVASLSRPGGNVTGVSILNVELVPKRLDLLSEVVSPEMAIGVIVNPNNPISNRMVRDTQDVAQRKGRRLEVFTATSKSEIDTAFDSMVRKGIGAVVVGTDPTFFTQRDQIVTLAARHAMPTIFGFPAAGALISYGTSLTGVYRQVGLYCGRILKGEKPADLPVLQPAKFELVVNLRVARSLGLAIPASVLAGADEVIE